MAEVLCVYRKVKLLKKAARLKRKPNERVAIVSYDEKPGIQAIATTSPDLPPVPGRVSERMCKQVSVSLPYRGDSHDEQLDDHTGIA